MLAAVLQTGLCKVQMRTADADGGLRTADGQERTKKMNKKNNKLIIEIVGLDTLARFNFLYFVNKNENYGVARDIV